MPVSAADAIAMSRRLAREDVLFGGTFSGANVVAMMSDCGIKYLSSEVYQTD